MRKLGWNKLALMACCVVCLSAGVAVVTVNGVTSARKTTRPAAGGGLQVANSPDQTSSAALPVAGQHRFVEAAPEAQAAAGNSVAAGSLVRALARAASEGNAKAVEDLLKGLPSYGEAARRAIEEELKRAESPAAKDALGRALASLKS